MNPLDSDRRAAGGIGPTAPPPGALPQPWESDPAAGSGRATAAPFRSRRSASVTGQLSQCHHLSPCRRMPAGVETAGTHRTRAGRRAPLTPQTNRHQSASRPDHGGGVRGAPADQHGPPGHGAFVHGTLRTEARLTRTAAAGDVSMCLPASSAAGAVLVHGHEPARFDQVTTGRAAIFTGGLPGLPDHRDGWRREPYAIDRTDVEAASAAPALDASRASARSPPEPIRPGRRDRLLADASPSAPTPALAGPA